MSIKLDYPIKIIFDEVEIDEYLPSIKFRIDIKIKQFTQFLAYDGDVWVDCNVWDEFSKGLKDRESALLNDMDDIFIIKIIKSNGFIEFIWSIKREDLNGNVMSACYSSRISDDVYSVIRNEFLNYSKWWQVVRYSPVEPLRGSSTVFLDQPCKFNNKEILSGFNDNRAVGIIADLLKPPIFNNQLWPGAALLQFRTLVRWLAQSVLKRVCTLT